MEIRTFHVRFNRRSTAEVEKLGQSRFEFNAPLFLTFGDLDLEALRDWIGETYEGVDAENEVLKLINGAIKDYAREASDPAMAVVPPRSYKRLSTFVTACVGAPDDEFRARLCALNPRWAGAVAGVAALVAAPTPPVVEPSGGKRRK